MFQANVVEKIKTHILCSITVFENRAVYDITWKKYFRVGRSQMEIRRMRIACRIPKATDTYSEYVILNGFSTAKMAAVKLLNVTFYVYYLPCWI
jgi:hypothetical protein